MSNNQILLQKQNLNSNINAASLEKPNTPKQELMSKLKLGAVIGIILLYLSCYSGTWVPGFDSSQYLDIAENIAQGKGPTSCGKTYTTLSPATTWFYAGIIKVFGYNFFLFNAINLAISMLAIYATWKMLLIWFKPNIAFWSTALFAINSQYIKLSYMIQTDVQFMLVFSLCIIAFHKLLTTGKIYYYFLAAFLAMLSILVRLPGIIILAPALLAMLCDKYDDPKANKRRKIILFAGISAALVGIIIVVASPKILGIYLTHFKSLGLSISNYEYWVKKFTKLQSSYARMIYDQNSPIVLFFLMIPILVGIFKSWKNGQRFMLMFPLVCTLAFIAIMARPRYMVQIVPFFAAMLIIGSFTIANKFKNIHAKRFFAIIFIFLFAGFNLPRAIKRVYTRHLPKQTLEAKLCKGFVKKGKLFNTIIPKKSICLFAGERIHLLAFTMKDHEFVKIDTPKADAILQHPPADRNVYIIYSPAKEDMSSKSKVIFQKLLKENKYSKIFTTKDKILVIYKHNKPIS